MEGFFYVCDMLLFDGMYLAGDVEGFRRRNKVVAVADRDGRLLVTGRWLVGLVERELAKGKIKKVQELPDGDFFARRDTQRSAKGKIREKPKSSNRRKKTGERALFLRIWSERAHVSEISGRPLVGVEHPRWHWQFMHVLPKGKHEELRLEPRNIMLGTWEEHELQTTRPDKCTGPGWDKFWRRQEEMRDLLNES